MLKTVGYWIGVRKSKQPLIMILLILNIISLLVVGYDKRMARTGSWRVAESTLLTLGLIGGALGIYLGMHIFHHKTRHLKFIYGIPFCLIANVATYYFLFTKL